MFYCILRPFVAIRVSLLFILCASAFVHLHGQDANPASTSIYRNFVGKWEGTHDYFSKDGQLKHSLVKLVITEDAAKHCMHLDTTYNVESNPVTGTRFIKLDPAKMTMEITQPGWPTDRYKVTSGLDDFARSGIGTIVATMKSSVGQSSIYNRVTIQLNAMQLTYYWANSKDGKDFHTYSDFQYTRTK